MDSTHYDPAGNVDSLFTRRRDTVTMTYDLLNRLATRTLPPVTYPLDSSAFHHLDAGVTNLFYPLCSLGVGGCPVAGGALPDPVIAGDMATFDYDATGRVTAARNGSAYVRRGYFPNGLIAAETLMVRRYDLTDSPTQPMHSYVTRYEYDLDGRRRFVRHPDQLVAGSTTGATEYVYDPDMGVLGIVRDVLGKSYFYGYDFESRLTQMVAPGGMQRIMSYDDDGRLVQDLLGSPAFGNQRLTTLAYDGRDKLLKSDNAVGVLDRFVAWYSGLGNVRRTTYHDGAQFAYTADEAFSVDALGNTYSSTQNSQTTYRGGSGWLAITGQTATVSSQFNSYEPGTGRLIAHKVPFQGALSDSAVVSYNAGGQLERDFTVRPTSSGGTQTYNDRALYYNALGQLVATDTRTAIVPPSPSEVTTRFTFEDYRYDAFGRRVLVRMRRQCGPPMGMFTSHVTCRINTIRRTVWDGDSELDEIQMPGGDLDGAVLENDTASVPLKLAWAPDDAGNQSLRDFTPFYGRVAYTNGLALDAPLGIVRFKQQFGYGQNFSSSAVFPPTTLALHWNARGRIDMVTFDDGSPTRCLPGVPSPDCLFRIGLQPGATVNQQQRTNVSSWNGVSLEAKVDGSGLLYRRNRYLDPMTGRFTQEDPIGLAGGMNLYGFAGGDPVNFSDPFGLMQCPPDCDNSDGLGWARYAGGMLKPAEKPLEIAAMVVTAPLTASGEASMVTLGVGAKAATFFRGVSAAEAAQIAKDGVLKAIGGIENAKFLTNTAEAAAEWGTRMHGAASQVVEVVVPRAVVKGFEYLGRIDGIGEAWVAQMQHLKDAAVRILPK